MPTAPLEPRLLTRALDCVTKYFVISVLTWLRNDKFYYRMKPVGYAGLIDRYELKGPIPWHLSFIHKGSRRLTVKLDGAKETYSPSYDPGESDLDHLLFALKYDGVDLRLLKAFFPIFNESELVEALRERTHSMPLRRLWFLYEWLVRGSLPIPDLETGNYGELLDPDIYFTAPLFRSPRQRVLVNTLGISTYCPVVRKTERLRTFAGKELNRKAGSLIQSVDSTVLARATGYLYMKESRTSWDIERLQPSQQRMARFLTVLRQAPDHELNKRRLIVAHNAIVDPDYFETNYRSEQVCVFDGPRIDYIAPRKSDVEPMMEALLAGVDHSTHSTSVIDADIGAMNAGHGRGEVLRSAITIDPVVHAAVVGFGFVYIHPFRDGNGRMHRFLLQQILMRRAFSPPDFIIPVSPAILRDREGYLRTLNGLSVELMPFIEYTRDDKTGNVSVNNDTADLYRYPDLTRHAEFLYEKVEDSIERDVHCEFVYLQTYDRAKLRARLVRQLTDLEEQTLLQLCFSEGRVSQDMANLHFPRLDPSVLATMVQAVQQTIAECPLPQSFLTAQALEQTRQ
jgi:hypothetical protein